MNISLLLEANKRLASQPTAGVRLVLDGNGRPAGWVSIYTREEQLRVQHYCEDMHDAAKRASKSEPVTVTAAKVTQSKQPMRGWYSL